jgi:hypothetical protein
MSYLTNNKNLVCCVCKSKSNLSIHHILPERYLHYSLKTININDYKIVLCRDCHDEYEKKAHEFDSKLVELYLKKDSNQMQKWFDRRISLKCNNKRMNRHKKKKVKVYIESNHDIFKHNTVHECISSMLKNMSDVNDFIFMWKFHFNNFVIERIGL